MIIEGRNAVTEALESENISVNKVLISNSASAEEKSRIIKLCRQKGIVLQFADSDVLKKLTKSGRNQGMIAYTTEFQYAEVDEILKKAEKENAENFIVILDGIEDPHNLGAIIRSCECAGVHGIIIGKNRACPVNDTVFKTSAGALSNMLIARVTNINQEIEKLKKKGIWVYGAEAGGQSIYKTNLKGNIAVVIGSEGNGISALTKKLCDGIISLPLAGKINSLNASVACGAVLFEIIRQQNK